MRTVYKKMLYIPLLFMEWEFFNITAQKLFNKPLKVLQTSQNVIMLPSPCLWKHPPFHAGDIYFKFKYDNQIIFFLT
jgi:hypothetical protein